MDQYHPQKKIALVVDEWGAWLAPLAGSNPGFLVQQNSLRDAILAALNLDIFARHADRVRMANIAQMINVLQAIRMTDHDRMVLTPTYHVFRMYAPFQDATLIPVQVDAGTYRNGSVTLPRVDAIAAKDPKGNVWLAVINLDPTRSVQIHTIMANHPVAIRAWRGTYRCAGGFSQHILTHPCRATEATHRDHRHRRHVARLTRQVSLRGAIAVVAVEGRVHVVARLFCGIDGTQYAPGEVESARAVGLNRLPVLVRALPRRSRFQMSSFRRWNHILRVSPPGADGGLGAFTAHFAMKVARQDFPRHPGV